MSASAKAAIRGKVIWMNDKLVPWDDANIHVMTHALHYGLGVFEGIRCYARADGRSAIFRLDEHIRRLFDSAHICLMDIPYSPEKLQQACIETTVANGFPEAYIRPIAYSGVGEMGLGAMTNAIDVAIAVFPWGAYLGEDGLQNGIRVRISSFARHHVNTGMAKGKISGQYVNSILAKREALLGGFDEAVMLDTDGFVAEASGENIFMIRDGILRTPPLSSSVLAGITRATLIKISRELGIPVIRQKFSRDELYTADEVFLSGTAAEVTPVREVDHRRIGSGKPGPMTRLISTRFFDIVRGEDTAHDEWLEFVETQGDASSTQPSS